MDAEPSIDRESFVQAAATLRALDRDRYAASLIVPPAHRAGVQAVCAFAAEAAAVGARVSEPAPGEIRLQWWADALEGREHGAVARNPVAAALLTTLRSYDLPAGPLLRLLAARRFDLYHDPMPDMDQFEGYAGETASILFQYAAMMLSGGAAEEAAEAAGHLGVGQALAGHLRTFGVNAGRGRLFLPLSVFSAHGVGEVEILTGRDGPALRAALDQLGEIARDHAGKARAAIARLPRTLRPAFAALVLVDRDLYALARRRENPFKAVCHPAPLRRLATLVWWGLRNS